MLENVGRKVFFVVAAVAISLGLLFLKEEPFRLGLDLEGGTRLVYRLDFEAAVEEGTITDIERQDTGALLNETITIIRNRVDPEGVFEPVIRAEGSDRIVIELPGTLGLAEAERAVSALGEALPAGVRGPVALEGGELGSFPETGGIVEIGGETIRYGSRDGGRLFELLRGHRGTEVTDHASGAAVELVSDDAIRARIESLGELSFQIVANDADFTAAGTDRTTEVQKLQTWVEANPEADIATFNRLEAADGGPAEGFEWYPQQETEETAGSRAVDRTLPVLVEEDEDWRFRGDALARVYPWQDDQGYPAVGFEMRADRRGDFGDFTEEYENRQMAIVLNGEIASAPTIDEKLPGRGIIRGRFSNDEVRDLITVLRSGSLKIRPQLEHEEIVGPTLGRDYVRRGFLSGVVALVLVLGFMVVYYRRLGGFAAVALAVSFLLLLGGLAFLDATLTLPGIAGIILTVGMAVDANILIFDRIREEGDKGRNLRQAAKTGFEKALSAILDANITTFLTAVILYKIGTGPVRGFAVTLMIGILTSVFAALVVTRLLVHWALSRGVKSFGMGQWMVTASYSFVNKAKVALTVSLLLIAGGLTLFFWLPEQEKLGIDFTGGAEVQLRTAEARTTDVMRERVASIPGPIGASAEVKPILNSAEEGGFTEFRAIFKTTDTGEADFEAEIKSALSDLLLNDGVQVEMQPEGAMARVAATLFFEGPHPVDDIAVAVADAGLSAVDVQQTERANTYRATGRITAGLTQTEVVAKLTNAFREASDSGGNAFRLATPIPSSSVVGPQVVGELRDRALLALAISLFVTVMYIRVRFAEYSYGYAAVAAVLHDVLVTLGVLTLANHFGLLNGEINLPMIAAFLTIVGYSLNDTIVIFDRIRENLPRMKAPLAEILDTSVNQTLSRTILTSLTTFLAVACLYVFNFGTGNVLESFSFAMMVGVVTGTYSTIFIANPILLWIESRPGRPGMAAKRAEEGRKRARKGKTDVATTQA